MNNTPMPQESASGTTVHYNREEGWIHVMRFTIGSMFPTNSEIHDYKDTTVMAWLERAHKGEVVYVFECKRMS